MQDQWHYELQGKAAGPVSEAQLMALLAGSAISPETPVWQPADYVPKPLKEALPHFIASPPPVPSTAPNTVSALPGSIQSSWVDINPHPWRRYFARMLDLMTFGSITAFSFSLLLYGIDPHSAEAFAKLFDAPAGRALDSLVTALFAIPLTALCIGLTGGSPGKWLFGIKIVDPDGRPIGIPLAFQREALVYWRGLGIGFPLVIIFTCLSSFKTLKNDGRTTWDAELLTRAVHRPTGAKQTVLYIVGGFLFLLLMAILRSL